MSRAALCALFAFAALPLSAHAAGQSPVGDWSGPLHRDGAAYLVRFHIQTAPDGKLTGAVSGLPGDDYTPVPAAVEASGDSLTIAVGAARYSGVWDQKQSAWVGSWKQADLSEPLALRWDSDDRVRVQAPKTNPIVTSRPRPPVPDGGALIVPPSAR